MKNRFLKFVLLAFAISVVGCESDEDISPSLNFDGEESVNIESSQRKYSINYKIQNRVQGAEVTAASDATWLSDISVEPTSGTISFTAAENYDAERSAIINIEYKIDYQELAGTEFEVKQAACEFSHTSELTKFSGYWMESYAGAADYYSITFSDKGWDENGVWLPGGIYYNLLILDEQPVDPYQPILRPGTYVLSDNGAVGVLDMAGSKYTKNGAELSDRVEHYFKSGYVVVEETNGAYKITAKLTDDIGETHMVSYTGSVVLQGLVKMPSIESDLNLVPNAAFAQYGRGDKEKMHCELRFSKQEISDIGIPVDRIQLVTEIFLKYDKDGRLTPGIYPFTEPNESGLIDGEVGTIFPGIPSSFTSDPTMVRGTYVKMFNETGQCDRIALLNKGTLTIEEQGEGYRITCDFTTEDGLYKVTMQYEGLLTIPSVPGRFSTLTGDYTLDLSNAVGTGTYFGDVYGNGSTAYSINLNPRDGQTGDGFMVEFVSKSFAYFNEPIPDGTFTAAPEDKTAMPGQFTQGRLDLSNGQLLGTVYVGGYAGPGMVGKVAPATSGSFNIRYLGEGIYIMDFKFLDDRGHTWNGSWQGKISLSDAAMNIFPVQSNLFKITK